MEKEFSRRNFLQGAGTVFALGGLSQLLGCTPNSSSSDAASDKGAATAEKSANASEAVSQAESNYPKWMGEPTLVKDSDISETIETDVLVIGCGTAGWAAAVRANR